MSTFQKCLIFIRDKNAFPASVNFHFFKTRGYASNMRKWVFYFVIWRKLAVIWGQECAGASSAWQALGLCAWAGHWGSLSSCLLPLQTQIKHCHNWQGLARHLNSMKSKLLDGDMLQQKLMQFTVQISLKCIVAKTAFLLQNYFCISVV